MIYHLTTRSAWEAARKAGQYIAPSLKSEGFIHCSTAAQLLPVANAFYRDARDPAVLWIDPEKLQAEVRWEAPDPADPFSENQFPHVYGPIELDAVVRITEVRQDADGRYVEF